MLSVVIITLNEEAKIRDCLESVKWANEIIVVDSCSRDKTVEIAREYTSKIHESWRAKKFRFVQSRGGLDFVN
jgi:glycosyltransferase involved in cell wall biosynthesis